jgi:hypothetical protein
MYENNKNFAKYFAKKPWTMQKTVAKIIKFFTNKAKLVITIMQRWAALFFWGVALSAGPLFYVP